MVPPPPAGFGDSPDHKPGGSNVVGAGLGHESQGNLLRGTVRVSVQGVKSLGGHFACLCRGLNFMK